MPRLDTRLACDFAGGVTDKSRFPFDVWRRCINDALRVQARGFGMYRDPAGEEKLRLAVSRYLAFNRAVQGIWQDVIVTQGAQQALDLLTRNIFAALGAKVVPVPVDHDGLVVARLPKAARLVYVLDAAAVAQAARSASIGLHPLAPFHLEAPVQSGFLFGYGGVDAERIDAALTSLATLLRPL